MRGASIRLACVATAIVVTTGAVPVPAAIAATGHYPDRPMHLVVPFPAGGGADHWGRLIAKSLSASLGQPVVVDNIPGAGGNKGTAVAAAAAPDGYTLLLGSVGPLAVHQFTYSTLDFDPQKSFTPIALLESSPIVLVAGSAVPASSMAELLRAARYRPGAISYASNGRGSPEEVAGEIFKKRAQVNLTHLPYDGAGPARKAVLAGEAGLMFDPCKGALPAIRQGMQRPLAVAAAARLPGLPDVPTFSEASISKYELRIWTGVLAPAGTPQEVTTRLSQAIHASLQTAEMKREIADEGGEVGDTTPAQFATYIQSERQHWSAL